MGDGPAVGHVIECGGDGGPAAGSGRLVDPCNYFFFFWEFT